MSNIEETKDHIYFLMDRSSRLLASAVCDSPPQAPNMKMRIIEGRKEDVVASKIIQVFSPRAGKLSRLGRVVFTQGDVVMLEPLRSLGEDLRENLRVPVDFKSFVYLSSGGREPVQAKDLSSESVAFYCHREFRVGEQMEIVIPITKEAPLILKCKILRQDSEIGLGRLYAATFLDMTDEEESRVRESVFHVQLKHGSYSQQLLQRKEEEEGREKDL